MSETYTNSKITIYHDEVGLHLDQESGEGVKMSNEMKQIFIMVSVEEYTWITEILCSFEYKLKGESYVSLCNDYHQHGGYHGFENDYDEYEGLLKVWRENHPLHMLNIAPPFNDFDTYKLLETEVI